MDGRDRTLRNTDFEVSTPAAARTASHGANVFFQRGGRHGRGWGDEDSDNEDGSGNRKGGRRRRLTGDEDGDADSEGRDLKSAKVRAAKTSSLVVVHKPLCVCL